MSESYCEVPVYPQPESSSIIQSPSENETLKSKEQGSVKSKLFISNLNSQIQNGQLKTELETLFQRHGRIESMNIRVGFPKKAYKYAFVTMQSEEVAKQVLEKYNNYSIFDRPMLITEQKERNNNGKKYFTNIQPLLKNIPSSENENKVPLPNIEIPRRLPYHINASSLSSGFINPFPKPKSAEMKAQVKSSQQKSIPTSEKNKDKESKESHKHKSSHKDKHKKEHSKQKKHKSKKHSDHKEKKSKKKHHKKSTERSHSERSPSERRKYKRERTRDDDKHAGKKQKDRNPDHSKDSFYEKKSEKHKKSRRQNDNYVEKKREQKNEEKEKPQDKTLSY